MDFYIGRVLRLDMTALTATVEPLSDEWTRLYVGGKGLLLRYLFDELAPGTDALAPENPLILASGPFAGTAAATCSRLAVGCKSPATGTLLDSYVGGSFAPELKFAGYDVVVVTGRAPHPVLVLVEDDRVEFLPAEGRFWGLETAALEQKVREEMGPWHKVLSTGPAGEQLVPFACLSTDQYHKAGRGGAGAVMGSKNLKAVVVRGTGAVKAGDAAAFTRDLLALQEERILTADNAWTWEEGTPYLVEVVNAAGALPTRNWRSGQFEDARGDPVGGAAARAHQDPRLHPVSARLPPGPPVRRPRLRGAGVRDARALRRQLRHRRPGHDRRLQRRLRRARSRHDVHRAPSWPSPWTCARRAPRTTASPSATPRATSRRRA